MPLMALTMELLSCALPGRRSCGLLQGVGKILHGGEDALVRARRNGERVAGGRLHRITSPASPAKVMACPLVYVPEVTTVPPELTTW